MLSRQRLLSIAIGCLLAGCGRTEPPFTDNSNDTEKYAESVRTMVESNCKAARGGDAGTHLAPVYLELNRDDRPVGSRKELFDQMRAACNEAVDRIRGTSAGRPDINAQLDKMIELAGQLPKSATTATTVPK